MWSNSLTANTALLLAVLSHSGFALSNEVCPQRKGQPLRSLDVFGGAPEQLAYLQPEETGKHTGYWNLGKIYDDGEYVTVRCKYADGQHVDAKLAERVKSCHYWINRKKRLILACK
jgi:hypothetical protein